MAQGQASSLAKHISLAAMARTVRKEHMADEMFAEGKSLSDPFSK